MRHRTRSGAVLGGVLVALLATCVVLTFPVGRAFAATPTVTVPWPPGNPANGQTVTVSGGGFPTRTQHPAGLFIIECADPGGSAPGLPRSLAQCDTTTEKSVLQNNFGHFSTPYTIVALTQAPSPINCDQTHYCVLWVGIDPKAQFTTGGTFAFSAPLRVGAPPALAPETPLVIGLPIVGAVIGAIAYVTMSRRPRAS